jgi:hypothetical protein
MITISRAPIARNNGFVACATAKQVHHPIQVHVLTSSTALPILWCVCVPVACVVRGVQVRGWEYGGLATSQELRPGEWQLQEYTLRGEAMT